MRDLIICHHFNVKNIFNYRIKFLLAFEIITEISEVTFSNMYRIACITLCMPRDASVGVHELTC